MELKGKVAIVTGGGRGIGEAHVRALAAYGAKVVVNDCGVSWSGGATSESRAERLAAEIRQAGGDAVHDIGDCSSWPDAKALVERAVDAFGDLNILVLNAGINRAAAVADLDESDWNDTIRVHLTGSLAPVHFAVRYWQARAQGKRSVYGRIITTSSQAALVLGTELAGLSYMTAKAGILGFTQGLAGELAPLGVTVNCIIPGSSHHGVSETVGARGSQRILAERVSPMVVFLSTPGAASITGAVFQCIGGRIDRIHPAQLKWGLFADKVWRVDEIAALYDEFLTGPRAPTAAEFLADIMPVLENGEPTIP